MTTSLIKKKIIERLSKSDDEQLLMAIYDLLKDESNKEVMALTPAQISALKAAEEEMAQGKFLTDAEVRKRTKVWLGK